jgi:transposase
MKGVFSMRAYSMDLRERVMADVDGGMKAKDAAIKYRVSTNWIGKLKRIRKQTGRIAPIKQRTSRTSKLDDALPQLEQLVQQQPDATLKELRAHLGLTVGVSTIWRALKRLQYTFKKKSYMLPSSDVPMYKFDEPSGKLIKVGFL